MSLFVIDLKKCMSEKYPIDLNESIRNRLDQVHVRETPKKLERVYSYVKDLTFEVHAREMSSDLSESTFDRVEFQQSV